VVVARPVKIGTVDDREKLTMAGAIKPACLRC
jgi:hypothetical protein